MNDETPFFNVEFDNLGEPIVGDGSEENTMHLQISSIRLNSKNNRSKTKITETTNRKASVKDESVYKKEKAHKIKQVTINKLNKSNRKKNCK